MSDKTPRGAEAPARLDDPHLLPSAKNPKRMEALAALAMVIGMAGFAAFIFVYWINADNKWEALTLGIGVTTTDVITVNASANTVSFSAFGVENP